MSEFKFQCSVCGQHIKTDSGCVGTQFTCPNPYCLSRIMVPQPPAQAGSKLNYEIMPGRVETLEQYCKLATSVYKDWELWDSTTHPWFRGQSSSSWGLLPGLYRGTHDPHRERELLRDFNLKARSFFPHTPANDLEWLFILQHHEIPTRLLDWTESYQNALYFAVLDTSAYADGAVWALDPWALNEVAIGHRSVPVASSAELAHYAVDAERPAKFPAAVRPSHDTKTVSAQKGMFTLHGSELKGIEELMQSATPNTFALKKIIIASEAKKFILKELLLAGVGSSSLFPDVDGIAREIKYKYSYVFINEAKKRESAPIHPEKREKGTVVIDLPSAFNVKSLPLSQELPAAPLAPTVRQAAHLLPSPLLPTEADRPSFLRRLRLRLGRIIIGSDK